MTCFRSVIVKMMLIVDVFYNLSILEKNLTHQPAKRHVTIVWRSKVVLRRMSLRSQSDWSVTVVVVWYSFLKKSLSSLSYHISCCPLFNIFLQVELVKLTGQQFSSSHILEVYRGSFSQFVSSNYRTCILLSIYCHLFFTF